MHKIFLFGVFTLLMGVTAILPRPGWCAEEPPLTVDFPSARLFNGRPPFLAGVKLFHEDLVYREGETLRVKFTAEREAYLYLLYHQANRITLLLFPNEAQPENRVPGRQDMLVPDLADSFAFRVQAPLGTEVLQVLASLEPLEELDNLLRKDANAVFVPRKILDSLCDRLLKEPATWTEHRVPIETVSRQAEFAPRTPSRVGLFIGVNKYQNPKLCQPLEELRRGAELMAKVFVDRGGLDPQHTRLILGEDATRDNLQEAFVTWLPSVSKPGDTVFIFYTGHGLRLSEANAHGADVSDHGLTTYDNDVGENIGSTEELEARLRQRLILDDVLARWLQELVGRQVVLMLDSCHSGGMVDGRRLARFFQREAARVKSISQLNVTVITGCGPDETVRTPIGEGRVSWMPYFFDDAMRKFPRPLLLQEAFVHYATGMRPWLEKFGAAGLQEPQMFDSALIPIVLAPAERNGP